MNIQTIQQKRKLFEKYFLQHYKQHQLIQLHFHLPNYLSRNFYIHKDLNLQWIKKKLQQRNLLGLFDNFCYEFNKNIINMSQQAAIVFPYQEKMPGNNFFVEIKITSYTKQSLEFHFEAITKILQNPIKYKFLQISSFEKNMNQLSILIQTVNNRKITQFHPSLQAIKSEYLNPKKHFRDIINFNLNNNLRKNVYKGIGQPKLVIFFNVLKDKKISHDNSLKGHIMYFKLITLENKQFLIAGTEDGFTCIEDDQKKLQNNSKQQQQSGQYFICLLELFKSVSKKFQNVLDQYIKNFKLDMITYAQARRQKPQLYWLTKPKQYDQKFNQLQMEKQFYQYVNWNLMYKDNFIQGATINSLYSQRSIQVSQCSFDQFLSKKHFFNDLERAMIFISKPLILNNVDRIDQFFKTQSRLKASLIDQDIKCRAQNRSNMHFFVQNSNISTCLELTYVKNLSVIHKILNIDNVRPFFAGMVDSRGKKIFVKQKIPNQYLFQSVRHGYRFPVLQPPVYLTCPTIIICLKKIAKQLNLQEEAVCYQKEISKQDTKLPQTFLISPFILGYTYNGINYISQINRFSVRDLNYLGKQNQMCFLRFQLLKKFMSYKDKKGQKYEKFNVNIEVDQVQLVQSQKLNDQIATLFEIANHIRAEAIPELISSLKLQGSITMTNSKTLSYAFHKCGINMRYLGQVVQHEQIKNQPHIKLFLKRVILVRTLKQYFRVAMRQTKVSLLRETVAHILNCVFGKIQTLKQLQQKCFKKEQEEIQKRKKKLFSKNKLQNQNEKVKHLKSYTNYLLVGPRQVWKQIVEICKIRFNFDLCLNIYKQNQQGIFSYPYTKLATLQDLCQSIGVCINQKNYDIIQISQKKLLKEQHQRQQQVQRQKIQKQKEKLKQMEKQKQMTKSKKQKKKKKEKQIEIKKQKQEKQEKEKKQEKQKKIQGQTQIQKEIQRQINQEKNSRKKNSFPFQTKDILQFKVGIQCIKEEFPDYGTFSAQTLKQNQSVTIFELEDIKTFALLRQKMQYVLDPDEFMKNIEQYQLIFLRLFQAECIPFSFSVSQSMTRIGMKNIFNQKCQVALFFSLKALYMMLITYGETYPHVFMTILTIQNIYEKMKLSKMTIKFYQRMLEILQPVYSQFNQNMPMMYSRLAALFFKQKQLNECIQYQTKALELLKKKFNSGDPAIQDAQYTLFLYRGEQMAKTTQPFKESSQKLIKDLFRYMIE